MSLLLGGLLLAVFTAAGAETTAVSGSVAVRIDGVRGRGGVLCVNLYRGPDGFPSDSDKALRKHNIVLHLLPVRAETEPITTTFSDLPPGEYAVCAFHDANSNGELDTNVLGMPREDWGVSNNAHPRFRAPRFGEARFVVEAGAEKTVAFCLRH